MKGIIGGLLLILLVPVRVFAYADTPQDAVQQPCGTVQQIKAFINTYDCPTDQKVQKFVHVCAGEVINGVPVTESNEGAAIIICQLVSDQTLQQARIADDARHAQEIKDFFNSIGKIVKWTFSGPYQVLIYILAIRIPWVIIKAILITVISMGFILWLAYWLGGGR